MDNFAATQISAAGMLVQKARIEAATLNLANMHTSSAPGAPGYRPVMALIQSVSTPFWQVLHGKAAPLVAPRAELVAQNNGASRSSYEPGHPHADPNGMVSYPAVDSTQEMMTVVTALRAYEANLAALQATKALASRALDIGAQ